jgi:hypothetical protein
MARGKDRFSRNRDGWRLIIHSMLHPLPQDRAEDSDWVRDHAKDWLDRLSRADGWQREGYIPELTLSKAFSFFGLDKTNKRDRAILLNVLADIVFAQPKKGRPGAITKSWDPARLLDLAIRDHQCGLNNDSKTAEELKERFKGDYKGIQREAIRQRLPEARQLFENLRAGNEVIFGHHRLVWALDLKNAYQRGGIVEEVKVRPDGRRTGKLVQMSGKGVSPVKYTAFVK